MDENLKQFQKSIKKKHRFSFWDNPTYREQIDFAIEANLFINLCKNVIEDLGWRLIASEKDKIIAESNEKWKTHGIIEISLINESIITVKSETMLDQKWDNGQNSVRVGLFLKAFKEEFEKLTVEQKKYSENYEGRNYEFHDYEYPSQLPQELDLSSGNIIYPAMAGILTTSLFSIMAGYLMSKGYFIGFVRELIFGLVLWFIMMQVAKARNYLKIRPLLVISILSFLSLFLISEFSKYLWLTNNYSTSSFFNYWGEIFLHFSQLISLPNILILPLFLSVFYLFYSFYRMSLVKRITSIKNAKIPSVVIQFVRFLKSEGRKDSQIRDELRSFGWTSKETQDFLIDRN